jgi:hypothetical protein
MPSTDSPAPRGWLRRVLEPTLYLWLRSQAESVQDLQVHVESSDRELFTGTVTQVQLAAQQVVYRGLHLSQITLTGHNIRINLGHILKGHPLQLLAPVPVDFAIEICAADVQSSFASPLLQEVLLQVLQILVGEQLAELSGVTLDDADWTLQEPILTLGAAHLRFNTALHHPAYVQPIPVALQTGLILVSPHTLALQRPEWLVTPKAHRGLPLSDLDGYQFELGSQIQFQDLTITADGLTGNGQLFVMP